MNYKETELKPVLLQKLCPECKEGTFEYIDSQVVEEHFFKSNQYKFIYKCKHCGYTLESDHRIRLNLACFVNPETGERFVLQTYPTWRA
jgi:ribosomal protein S27AE